MKNPARPVRHFGHAWLVAFLATLWFAPCNGQALGQDPSPKPSVVVKEVKEGRGKWVPVFQRHADEYVVTVGANEPERAKRLADPLLRWWQPVRGGDDGALYLWVVGGRPVAALTFFTFKWPDGRRAIVHERHSLASEPVEATWRDQQVWHTSKPGVTFQAVPDSPVPAATPAARLRQMQTIVRDLSANTVDSKGSTWPLRALAKPLYRFDGPSDGALFALAQGTDPEAFVLLEVAGSGSDARWRFAVARFTDLEIHVRYKDAEIFTGPNSTGASNGIYHSTTAVEKPSDTPEDFN
jgi:hypothetical protein